MAGRVEDARLHLPTRRCRVKGIEGIQSRDPAVESARHAQERPSEGQQEVVRHVSSKDVHGAALDHIHQSPRVGELGVKESGDDIARQPGKRPGADPEGSLGANQAVQGKAVGGQTPRLQCGGGLVGARRGVQPLETVPAQVHGHAAWVVDPCRMVMGSAVCVCMRGSLIACRTPSELRKQVTSEASNLSSVPPRTHQAWWCRFHRWCS